MFTFRTIESTGMFRSFYPDHHDIKLNGGVVGSIFENDSGIRVQFHVEKEDIMEDGNPNCSWKNITLRKIFETVPEAKTFLNDKIDKIHEQYTLHCLED